LTAFGAKLAAARAVGTASRISGRGGGTTLPGRLLLRMEPDALRRLGVGAGRNCNGGKKSRESDRSWTHHAFSHGVTETVALNNGSGIIAACADASHAPTGRDQVKRLQRCMVLSRQDIAMVRGFAQ